jgi:transposase
LTSTQVQASPDIDMVKPVYRQQQVRMSRYGWPQCWSIDPMFVSPYMLVEPRDPGIPEPDRELHIILDNLFAHKARKVAAFLDAHPNVQLHFTPTYSSWLNQVELWFSKLQRDVIARGVFTSTADLARKLRRYINAYSKNAKPFRWKYSNSSRRIPYAQTSSATVN